ncbi:MAG TPA: sporulation inhibitor of replication protein SirA [Massilibacterium sp.]|nr:sporulation inhibitor of replication protein SirA [Massilibacterium sp.]
MRHYQIYLMDEVVAHDYFGKEHIIYDLFKGAMKAKSKEHFSMLQKQIAFITEKIPLLTLHRHLSEECKETPEYHSYSFVHEKKTDQGKATLTLEPNVIILTVEGNPEMELFFFEKIRTFSPYFLAMDFVNERCGWLKPVKKERYVY